jgi:outer membrane protein
MYSLIAAALMLVVFMGAQAQERWSLQKCIDYALENNIQNKQQVLNSEYYNNQNKQAKFDRLPNQNAGFQNKMNF